MNWVLLGLARCYNGFGDATKAVELCERIISKTANAIDAYDLVSECYINLGMFEKAFTATKLAIEQSPNSIPRQRRLAKLCLRYNEYDAAYNACKKLQALGNYSSLVQVEDCVLWLICASYLMYAKPSSRTISITREISQIYRQIEKYDAIQANLAIELHKAYHQYRLKPEEFEQNQFEKVINNVVSLPDPLKPYLVDLLVLLESLLDDNPIKISLSKATEAAKSQLYTQDNQNRAIDYNKSGQLKYSKKEYKAAFDAFKVAFQNAPDNPNIALNLLQTSYKLLGSKNFVLPLELFSLCKQTLNQLAPSDHRYEQSKNLLLHIETKLMSNLK
jgi:tetratricopeptide (TPR) repeat protein